MSSFEYKEVFWNACDKVLTVLLIVCAVIIVPVAVLSIAIGISIALSIGFLKNLIEGS